MDDMPVNVANDKSMTYGPRKVLTKLVSALKQRLAAAQTKQRQEPSQLNRRREMYLRDRLRTASELLDREIARSGQPWR